MEARKIFAKLLSTIPISLRNATNVHGNRTKLNNIYAFFLFQLRFARLQSHAAHFRVSISHRLLFLSLEHMYLYTPIHIYICDSPRRKFARACYTYSLYISMSKILTDSRRKQDSVNIVQKRRWTFLSKTGFIDVAVFVLSYRCGSVSTVAA